MLNDNVSPYLNSSIKKILDVFCCVFLFISSFPFMVVVGFILVITQGRPLFFVQERIGKDGKRFRMYKFRTMRVGAENEQNKYKNLNEANGPVFKIRNDPRFVGIGKWLSHSGLDELPQLYNVLRGDMSLVGPRPLPTYEHESVSKRCPWRTSVKPGIVSLWVIDGSHSLSFDAWMKKDRYYMSYASLTLDLRIIWNLCWAIPGMIMGR